MMDAQKLFRATFNLWALAARKLAPETQKENLPGRTKTDFPAREPAEFPQDNRRDAESLKPRRWL
ncbi:hypothetical protein ACFFIY_05650 [Bhargavaea ullalensis]|uniref:Uncharacterized protein n=1 Tax=Bhargavaea ullalensis TaxID=1265685 RepID=A0ABV2GD17_9BACL